MLTCGPVVQTVSRCIFIGNFVNTPTEVFALATPKSTAVAAHFSYKSTHWAQFCLPESKQLRLNKTGNTHTILQKVLSSAQIPEVLITASNLLTNSLES
jgi:hypothetical protein